MPHSYWSREGLSLIAQSIGTPLTFDEVRSKFEPLKFTRIQVELAYSAHRPPFLMVLVKYYFGVDEDIKVDVQYAQLPY